MQLVIKNLAAHGETVVAADAGGEEHADGDRADWHGFANPRPEPGRPSTLIKVGELNTDRCDRRVVMRMAGAGSIPPLLSGVLVTHLHSDHLTDLNDVITTHWVMSPGPRSSRSSGRRGSLDLLS